MRTITIYNIKELSEKAQRVALNEVEKKYLEDEIDEFYRDMRDLSDALSNFFNRKIFFSSDGYSYVHVKMSRADNMNEEEFRRYMNKHLQHSPRRYYTKDYKKHRTSKVLFYPENYDVEFDTIDYLGLTSEALLRYDNSIGRMNLIDFLEIIAHHIKLHIDAINDVSASMLIDYALDMEMEFTESGKIYK